MIRIRWNLSHLYFFKWPRYLVLNYHIFFLSLAHWFLYLYLLFFILISFHKSVFLKKKIGEHFFQFLFRSAALPMFSRHHLLWGEGMILPQCKTVMKEAVCWDLPDSWQLETWPLAKWRPWIEKSSSTNSQVTSRHTGSLLSSLIHSTNNSSLPQLIRI